MAEDFLLKSIILLGAGLVFVPIAKKLGLGSVLGYLIAGMVIGPFVLGWVGQEGEDMMHAAEFGVVMMLFVIGLEIDPKEFWVMRRSILGLGGIQLFITSIIVGAILHLFFNLSHATSLAIALTLGMSSTAIILQTLKEKGWSKTSAGQASFSVLLFQDIMVIPILALLPLLAVSDVVKTSSSETLIADLPAWLKTLTVLGAMASIVIVGQFIVAPIMNTIAKTRLRELFTAMALFLVIGVAYLMKVVGLSPALGTFLAGVVLANSSFRHELESDIEPFKGLLLGIFFIGVGSTINFELIGNKPILILSMVIGIMLIKALVLLLAGKVFKIKNDQNLLFAFLLSQVGEFAFVLLNFSNQLNIIDKNWNELLMAVSALSMTVTPILLLINERLIDPYFGTKEVDDSNKKPHDEIDNQHSVIIAGFGHFGSTIGRFLRANGINATILDSDSDRVDVLRKMGFEVYYGDATRLDLLKAAGAETAKMLIAVIDNTDTNHELISICRKHFPNLKIMARARNRFDAYNLIDEGVEHIYRETLYTSVHMAVDVLNKLGIRNYTATRKAQDFIRYDEEALVKLAKSRHDSKEYIITVREQIELEEKLLSEDLHLQMTNTDKAWDSELIKKGINS
jgi:CPA2 family monovalent cation:H+ antiporter-2